MYNFDKYSLHIFRYYMVRNCNYKIEYYSHNDNYNYGHNHCYY